MVSITIPDLEPQMLEQLKDRAVNNGISIEEEAKRILQNNLQASDWEKVLQEIREIRASMPPQTTDSAELIREDRDNR